MNGRITGQVLSSNAGHCFATALQTTDHYQNRPKDLEPKGQRTCETYDIRPKSYGPEGAVIRHAALCDSGLTRFCADHLTLSELFVKGLTFSIIRLSFRVIHVYVESSSVQPHFVSTNNPTRSSRPCVLGEHQVSVSTQ